MLDGVGALYIIYAAAGLAGIMAAEATYLLLSNRGDRRSAINRRMKLQQQDKLSQEQVLVQLRKERGIAGASLFSLNRFRRLRSQSGLVTPLPRFLAMTSGIVACLLAVAMWYGLPPIFALIAFPLLAALLPVMALKQMRKRRHAARVVAEARDELDLRPRAPRRDGLVRPLAAEGLEVFRREDRLARRREVRAAQNDIHIAGAEDENTAHDGHRSFSFASSPFRINAESRTTPRTERRRNSSTHVM